MSTLPVAALRSVVVGRNQPVVDGVSCELVAGTITAIVGPSGGGKTTLLATLCGDLRPLAGHVELGGRALQSWRRDERARHLAVLPQDSSVAFSFAALDVVLLGLFPFEGALSRQRLREHARGALDRTGVGHLASRPIDQLSGGERQRVLLSRVAAQMSAASEGPRLLVLDEPTSSLDVAAQQQVFAMLRDLARTGVAVVASVHDLNLAAAWADRVLVVARGRMLAAGPVDEVFREELLAQAFGVPLGVHRVSGLGHPVVQPRR